MKPNALWLSHHNGTATCSLCKLTFPTPAAALIHAESNHANLYCIRCSRLFRLTTGLSSHLRKSARHRVCEECGGDFGSKEEWEGHFEREHQISGTGETGSGEDERRWKCARCGDVFGTKEELDAHVESAHWVCRTCEKQFGDEWGLLRVSSLNV
jgi:uncharacterized C2H2 Zn-finger protein